VPILLSAIQIFLLLLVFPYDTPVSLKASGDWEALLALMAKLYKKDQV
jgi:hypothetical protein